jgi:hypothetical protein
MIILAGLGVLGWLGVSRLTSVEGSERGAGGDRGCA